jgi:hypothetical protein
MMEAYRATKHCILLRILCLGQVSEGYFNYGTPNMNRLLWLVSGIVLLMNPFALLAQRRGGHGAGTARAPVGASSTDDLKDFKRAVALQARPDQVVQFRRLTEGTEVARKSAQDLLKLAESASKSDLFRSTNPLTSALEVAQSENQKFLETFSTVQKSGLKEVTKKLDKANSDVTKHRKALTRDLERPVSRFLGSQRNLIRH